MLRALETATGARGRGRSLLLNDLVFTDREVVGSLAYYAEFEAANTLLEDGRTVVEPRMTGRIELDDIVEKGLDELVAHQEWNIKILVSSDGMPL